MQRKNKAKKLYRLVIQKKVFDWPKLRIREKNLKSNTRIVQNYGFGEKNWKSYIRIDQNYGFGRKIEKNTYGLGIKDFEILEKKTYGLGIKNFEIFQKNTGGLYP